MYKYTSQRKAPEIKKNHKGAKITLLLLAIISAGFIGWMACANFTEWREERAACLEQAEKIERAWCTDNNKLVK